MVIEPTNDDGQNQILVGHHISYLNTQLCKAVNLCYSDIQHFLKTRNQMATMQNPNLYSITLIF